MLIFLFGLINIQIKKHNVNSTAINWALVLLRDLRLGCSSSVKQVLERNSRLTEQDNYGDQNFRETICSIQWSANDAEVLRDSLDIVARKLESFNFSSSRLN